MSHYEAAEKLLRYPPRGVSDFQPDYIPALAEAVLALIDKLDELPMVGFRIHDGDEDVDDQD